MNRRNSMKRIAVKIGSAVLTRADGTLDVTRLSSLVDQIAELRHRGIEVILISSGAVASGRGELHLSLKSTLEMDSVEQRQLFSAVGQAKLINRYYDFLREHHIPVGQVLTQKTDFDSEEHRENMRRCMEVMLSHGVLPVVNENDTVCITEFMFTDNDELSGLIARLMGADTLILLSNVDGLYNGRPGDEGVSLIPVVEAGHDVKEYIQAEKSGAGRGGMQSKCKTAMEVAASGIDVLLARGNRENVLVDLVSNALAVPHTHFVPGKP